MAITDMYNFLCRLRLRENGEQYKIKTRQGDIPRHAQQNKNKKLNGSMKFESFTLIVLGGFTELENCGYILLRGSMKLESCGPSS